MQNKKTRPQTHFSKVGPPAPGGLTCHPLQQGSGALLLLSKALMEGSRQWCSMLRETVPKVTALFYVRGVRHVVVKVHKPSAF